MGEIEEIVHIVPLGHEIDRAVKPFERYKANKAERIILLLKRLRRIFICKLRETFIVSASKRVQSFDR